MIPTGRLLGGAAGVSSSWEAGQPATKHPLPS